MVKMNEPEDRKEYRIGELAEKAGVTRRTIHYYTGRGLLPAPYGQGLGTTYGDEHYYRILLIKQMQENYVPLEEIKKRIAILSISEVKEQLQPELYREQMIDQSIISEYTTEQPTLGTTYTKIQLANGVELHVPADNPKAQQLAHKLYEYAEQLLKKG